MTGLHERKCLCGCGTVLSDNSHRRDAVFATPACGRRWRGERRAKGLSTDVHEFLDVRERNRRKRGTGVSVYLSLEEVRAMRRLLDGRDSLSGTPSRDVVVRKFDRALERHGRRVAA